MSRSALMLLFSVLILCILVISICELPDEIDWRDCRKEWGAACDCS
jgi:hypothetical protein